MASSATYFSILIFLTLSSSLHVDARESKFFSKVTNDNNAQEVLPTKEHDEEPLNKPEQEPNFIPQNQQNSGGYGLYGHESGQLPPTTTTTTTENLPYKTETENSYNKEFNPSSNNGQYYNNDAYVNPESYSNSNNGQYYNNYAYDTNPRPQGMSDTRFMNKVYRPYTTPINKQDNYFNGGNMYNNRLHGIGETKLGVTSGNNEKQGMSDTRFMENGRYYYDLNRENNYNLNDNNVNENSRNEYYNNRGNYGNSYRGQYESNENYYEANNSMEGYNSGNQEEFQESQNEQFLPWVCTFISYMKWTNYNCDLNIIFVV